jgi:hypothetical protein
MGFFRNNTKRMVQEFKNKSEYYSNDLNKEIIESYEDLKSEYDEHSQVLPEFLEFISQLKNKLSTSEAAALNHFTNELRQIDRCAKNGIEALRSLSLNQKKITKETLRLYEEFE